MEPILFSNSWFITIFVNTLPFQSVLRIFDIFWDEGDLVIYRVGLAIIKILEKTIVNSDSLVVVMNLFSNLHTPEFEDSDLLIKTAFSFNIDEKKIKVFSLFIIYKVDTFLTQRNGTRNTGKATLFLLPKR